MGKVAKPLQDLGLARRKLLSVLCELGNTRTAGLETGLEGAIGPGALS